MNTMNRFRIHLENA